MIMAFASQLNGVYADLIDASRTAFFGSASMVRSKSSLFDSLMPPRPSARLQLVAPQPLTAPQAITAAQFVDGLAAQALSHQAVQHPYLNALA
jgi:hypothetical protein